MKNFVLAISALLSLSLAHSASAHHSVPVNFDMESNHTITGTIKETNWRNPHSHLVLEVTNEAGETETWLVEWNAINTIRRLLKKSDFSIEDFVVGETITVTGWLGRHNKSVYFREAIFSDGRTFVWRTPLSPSEQAAN